MTTTTRSEFVARRNSFYAAMRQAERQGMHEERVGASGAFSDISTMARFRRMKADYEALCRISGLEEPTQADFDLANAIFKRHG